MRLVVRGCKEKMDCEAIKSKKMKMQSEIILMKILIITQRQDLLMLHSHTEMSSLNVKK